MSHLPAPSSQSETRVIHHTTSSTRSRASVACIKCRERKVKCNVQSKKNGEPCQLCKRAGTECVVKYDDNRKINASKKYVKQLEGRIGSLEAFIKSVQGGDLVAALDQMRAQSNSQSPNADSRTGSNRQESPVEKGTVHIENAQHMAGDEERTNNDMEVTSYLTYDVSSEPHPAQTSNEFSDMLAIDSDLQHFEFTMSPATESNSLTMPEFADHRNSVDAEMHNDPLSSHSEADMALLGFWPSDGSERPMQASSQIMVRRDNSNNDHSNIDGNYVLHMSSHGLQPVSFRNKNNRPASFADTEAFQVKYIQMWWKFSDMSAHLVEPDLFMRDYQEGVRSPYYSDFALNALLACSIRLDKDESMRKLSSTFAERAKKMLVDELDRPTMSTIHGLCLLGDWECTNGSENTGWIYVGIACRLIFDLGLHQDATDLVNAGSLRQKELLARQRLVYGCYVYERVWSVFLGRPSSFKTSHLHLPEPPADSSGYHFGLLAAWFDLSTLMRKMVAIFDRFHLDVKKFPAKLSALDQAVHDWAKSLPSDLQWADQNQASWSPALCALYMQYCNLQILYHRTVTSNGLVRQVIEQDRSNTWPYAPEISRRIMHDNAVKIARTLEFRRLAFEEWGFATLMLDIIFTAASTLIDCMVSSTDRSSALKDHKWLMCLLESCDGLKIHYPVVRRMLAVLDSLLESTGLSKFIWRGSASALDDNQNSDFSQDHANTDPNLQYQDLCSERAVSFDLKRWCRDRSGSLDSYACQQVT